MKAHKSKNFFYIGLIDHWYDGLDLLHNKYIFPLI